MEFSLWVVCLLMGICGWFDIRDRRIPVVLLLLLNVVALCQSILLASSIIDGTFLICLLMVAGIAAACNRGLMGGADLLISLAFLSLIVVVPQPLRAKAAAISIGISLLSNVLWAVYRQSSLWSIRQPGVPVVACSVPGFIILATFVGQEINS